MTLLHRTLAFGQLFIATLLITGCATQSDRLGLTVRAMNHTGKEIEYIAIEDPEDYQNDGGGEAILPYGGGGHVCCFGVPREWRPGLKARVLYKFTNEPVEGPQRPHMVGDRMPTNKRIVDIPPYDGRKASDIWTIMHADETVEVVVAGVEPTHPDWPGRVKGWPVASREYRLKLWQREVDDAKSAIALWDNDKSSDDLNRADTWKHLATYRREAISKFYGPDDPEFVRYLQQRRDRGLDWSRQRLKYLMEIKP